MPDAILNHVDYSTYYGKKFRPLYHSTDIWTEENSTNEETEANLVGQAGDNTFNPSVDA